MLKVLLFVFAASAFGQTCAYQTGKFPNGSVVVFRQGSLLRQGTDFTYRVTAGVPTITPINWTAGDKFSTLFSIKIPLNLPDNTAYTTFRIWQEDWNCPGTPPPPPASLAALEQCSGSGTPACACAGMLRATVKKGDGTTLIITGVTGITPGAQTIWTPVK